MASVTSPKQRRDDRRSARKEPARAVSSPEPKPAPEREGRVPWYRTTFALAMYSAVLLAAAYPICLSPLTWLAPSLGSALPESLAARSFALFPLAWIAPVFWLWLIRRPVLSGRRPYVAIWLAGVAYWLLVFHYLVLPHWSGVFGWLALALYLAFYIPAFVAVSRVAVHRLRVPLVVTAPVVWVGLELIRGHALTGISLALLGHTQVSWTSLIQIADAFGAYGVSFVVMLVAACVADTLPSAQRGWRWWPAPLAVGVVAAVLLYGQYRLGESPAGQSPSGDSRSVRVALVQGTVETVFDTSPEQAAERRQFAYDQYGEMTRAVHHRHNMDLFIWPESMFVVPDFVTDEPAPVTSTARDASSASSEKPLTFRDFALDVQGIDPHRGGKSTCPMLVGGHTLRTDCSPRQAYNSALLIDRSGDVAGRYYKMHLVIFGEYVPLGSMLPWLYNFSPVGPGLTAGERPQAFAVSGMRFAPSICFESIVPHMIHRHVRELTAAGTPPDVLVNVTNDGWFHGSGCLDQHLACNIFRAVENRRPMLVAANEGISAHIDGAGRTVADVPRRKPAVIVAEVKPDGRWGLYQQIGDLPFWGMALLVVAVGVFGIWTRRRS